MSALSIATRKSDLAQVQARSVARALENALDQLEVSIVGMTCSGDIKRDTLGTGVRDKREWIDDIEAAIVRGEVSIAVHSAKDVPVDIAQQTELSAVLKRVSPLDAFIDKQGVLGQEPPRTLASLPEGSTIGTSSLRRAAELKRYRGDLRIVSIRGNVPTRLEKLRTNPDLDGIVLAKAGLERLGIAEVSCEILSPELMMPAVNQGILVVQFKKSSEPVKSALEALSDRDTEVCWEAERACVRVLGADCRSAMGVFAEIKGDELEISARVLDGAGTRYLEDKQSGAPKDAAELGALLGEKLLKAGAGELLDVTSGDCRA